MHTKMLSLGKLKVSHVIKDIFPLKLSTLFCVSVMWWWQSIYLFWLHTEGVNLASEHPFITCGVASGLGLVALKSMILGNCIYFLLFYLCCFVIAKKHKSMKKDLLLHFILAVRDICFQCFDIEWHGLLLGHCWISNNSIVVFYGWIHTFNPFLMECDMLYFYV